MFTSLRSLCALALAGTLLVSFAGPVAAALPAFDVSTLVQAEASLATLVNTERAGNGLVALQVDPAVAAIARQRAEAMAATDLLSHKNPDGSDVFDQIVAAGIPWFGAGEVIVWNSWPAAADSTTQAVIARLGAASLDPAVDRLQLHRVRCGRVPGQRVPLYAGVLVKRTDRTGAWAKAGTTSKSVVDATRSRVTVRWTGGDPRLQVLTAGLRDYEVQRRVVGGSWRALGYKSTPSVTETLPRSRTYEYRVRARDRVGNRGAWVLITVKV